MFNGQAPIDLLNKDTTIMAPQARKDRFHRFRNRGEIAAWESHLNRRWPYRYELAELFRGALRALRADGAPLRVVEIATGPGMVARHLLTRMPHLIYTGVDYSRPLADYARRRLARFGDRARILQANLNADGWLAEITGDVDAFISLQSMHDLGDERRVTRIYREAYELLSVGGLFLNADFVVAPDVFNDQDPGRLSVARHFEALRASGYAGVDCLARHGDFACLCATK